MKATGRAIANRREEVSFSRDHRLERQQTLEIQIGTEKRERDPQVTNASLDRGVIAKKSNG
jgi:hypothetical protein